jgi:hypothetical protein
VPGYASSTALGRARCDRRLDVSAPLSPTPRCVHGPEERADGQRPNRQARAIGDATLFADNRGDWTRRITKKYVRGEAAGDVVGARTADERAVICLRPTKLVAVASV